MHLLITSEPSSGRVPASDTGTANFFASLFFYSAAISGKIFGSIRSLTALFTSPPFRRVSCDGAIPPAAIRHSAAIPTFHPCSALTSFLQNVLSDPR